MVVALTVTPAMALILCAGEAAIAQSRRSRMRCTRRHTAAPRSSAAAAPPPSLVARSSRAASAASRGSGQPCCPTSRSATSSCTGCSSREPPTTRRRSPRRQPELGHPRSAQLRRAHRAGSAATRSTASNFVENSISIEPDQDYDETLAASSRGRRYPGLRQTCRPTSRTDPGGADRRQRALVVRVYGHDLTHASPRRTSRGCVERSSASWTRTPICRPDPAPRRAGRPRQGAGSGSEARGRAQAGRRVHGAEELSDVYRTGKAYDVMVWSVPESRRNARQRARHPDRHPVRGHGPAR